MSFKLRLEKFMISEDLNPNSLSRKLGYKSSEKISRLIRDETNLPSYNILQDISNKFVKLNMRWLITGEENMYKSSDFKNLSDDDTNLLSEPNLDYNNTKNRNDKLEKENKELRAEKEKLLDIIMNLSKGDLSK